MTDPPTRRTIRPGSNGRIFSGNACRWALSVACGQEIGDANFCPKCGANQAATAPAGGAAASPTEGLAENVAGLLSYVLGSIVVFGGLTVIRIGWSSYTG